jgi:hypothetical protein
MPPDEVAVSDSDFANAPETTDFEGLSGGFDEVVAGVEIVEPRQSEASAPSSTRQQPPPAAPVSPPVVTTQPEVKPPAASPTPPVVTPSVVTQPQVPNETSQQPGAEAPQPSAAGSDFIGTALRGISENEPALIEALATQHFALNPAMVEALANGQGATELPRLFAHAHLRAMKSTMQMVADLVPRMIEDGIGKYRTEATQDSEFFRQYPQLNREKHGADIKAMAKALKGAYPKAKTSDLFAKIGPAVMAMHGIVAAASPGVAPATKPNGGAPFVPASAGRPPATSTQPAADSDSWSGLWSADD